MIETFWMVYGMHQRAPTMRHNTETSAVYEAKRLASMNPGIQFFVLEAIHQVVKRDVDVLPMGGRGAFREDDGIPF